MLFSLGENNYIKLCSKMRLIVRDCKNDHEWASSPDPISDTWRQKTFSQANLAFTSCSLFSSCDFKASGFLYLQVLHTHVQASAAFWIYSSQRSQLGGPERCRQTCTGFSLLRLRRPELREDQVAWLWQTGAPSGDSCGSNLVSLPWVDLSGCGQVPGTLEVAAAPALWVATAHCCLINFSKSNHVYYWLLEIAININVCEAFKILNANKFYLIVELIFSLFIPQSSPR